jgi:cytoplasmic FMR1 interacting protein
MRADLYDGGGGPGHQFLLYPLDLYNDAANRALYSLQQRFLYDEIEAELNLCFDQLIFKMSEQIYTYFKVQASRYGEEAPVCARVRACVCVCVWPWDDLTPSPHSLLMDKPYKQQLELIYSAARFHAPKSRYDVILKQRHLQVRRRPPQRRVFGCGDPALTRSSSPPSPVGLP